jgi:hypothetical protein
MVPAHHTDVLTLLAPTMTRRPTPSATMCGMMRSSRMGACMARRRSTLWYVVVVVVCVYVCVCACKSV